MSRNSGGQTGLIEATVLVGKSLLLVAIIFVVGNVLSDWLFPLVFILMLLPFLMDVNMCWQ